MRQKENSHQSPILFLQNCLQICRMSKENLQTDQSKNCRLTKTEKWTTKQGDATFNSGTRISPPLALTADHIPPQFSQPNFFTQEQVDNMPAIRRAFTRTHQPPTKPYEAPPMNIFAIQAAILDDIQGITNFTETYEESQMDPSTLLRTIRLLVHCENALETTAQGLHIAQPGTKFQYYRPVFNDFEDVLNALKTRLLCIANVPDEIRQAALNQLDDCIPPPPPGLPPPCPSSPAYSPVSWSPSTEDNDEYEADDAPSDSTNLDNESTIIE